MNRTTLKHVGIGITIGAVGATAMIANKLRGDRYVVIDMVELKKQYDIPDVQR